MSSSALSKINARVKQLAKKHPGKKRVTLQRQAGAEYKAGKLGGVKKKKAKKTGARARKRTSRTTKKRVGSIRSNADRVDKKNTTITIGSVSSLLSHAKKKLKTEIGVKAADLMTAKSAKQKRKLRKAISEKRSLYNKL
jgi:hypothetical protein